MRCKFSFITGCKRFDVLLVPGLLYYTYLYINGDIFKKKSEKENKLVYEGA